MRPATRAVPRAPRERSIARHGLRITLIALRSWLSTQPGAATLRMVEGRVLVRATNRAWRLAADDIVAGRPAIEEQM